MVKPMVGEIAERAQRFDALPQVLNLRHGEHCVLHAHARRALPDVNQPVFVAIHQRPQQNAADQREDRGVGADSERQREDHGDREALSSGERAEGVLHITPK